MFGESDLFDDDAEELENAFGPPIQSQSQFSQIQEIAVIGSQTRKGILEEDNDIDELVDEHEFRQGLARLRQSQATQGLKRSTMNPALGEPSANQSSCDKALFEIGVERRVNENNEQFFFIRGQNMTHKKLVRYIDQIAKEQPEKVDQFVATIKSAITHDEDLFKLFVADTVSSFGEEDTLLRALILAKSTQVPFFLLVIEKLRQFADEEISNKKQQLLAQAEKANNMASVCIAQIRYIKIVYDCKALFNCIFECPLETWSTDLRTKFLEAIPECFPDLVVQQDCLLNLSDLLVKGFEQDSLISRKALLYAMRMTPATSRVRQGMRLQLLKEATSMGPEITCEIILLCLEWAQIDDNGMVKYLTQIRENISFEDVLQGTCDSLSEKSAAALMSECLLSVTKILNMSTKGVKSAIKFLSLSGDIAVAGTQDDEEDGTQKGQKKFNMFDIMLTLALMNALGVDSGVMAPIKTQISTHPDSFRRTLDDLLALDSICVAFQPAMMKIAKQLLKTSDRTMHQFAGVFYERLLATIPSGPSRDELIKEMVALIISGNDAVSNTLLTSLRKYFLVSGSMLALHLPILMDIIKHIERMNTANVRLAFELLVRISFLKEREEGDWKNEVTPILERYFGAASMKEKFWGILGLLVHVEVYLSSSTEMAMNVREKVVCDRLQVAQMRTEQFPIMRAEFYRNLAALFRENKSFVEATYMMTWTNNFLTTFKRRFFSGQRKAGSASCLERSEYVSEKGLWINTQDILKADRAVEFVPAIELAIELCRYQHQYRKTGAPAERLMFLLEANLSFELKDDDVQRAECCDQLVLGIQYLRTILNMFSKSTKSEDIALLVKNRFALMFDCERELLRNMKKLDKYRLPKTIRSGEYSDVLVMLSNKGPSSNRKAGSDVKARAAKRKKPQEEGEVENESTREGSEQRQSESREVTPHESKSQLSTSQCRRIVGPEAFQERYLRPLEITTILDLVQLIGSVKEHTLYLLKMFRRTLNCLLPLKDTKRPSWLGPSKDEHEAPQFQEVPDSSAAWKLIHRFVKPLADAMNVSVEYLRQKEDESIGASDHYDEMADTLMFCLEMLKEIFSRKDVAMTKRQKHNEECERRRDRLMARTLSVLSRSASEDDTQSSQECQLVAYFLKLTTHVPNIKIACAIVELLSCFPHRSESQSTAIASFAWRCMLREWTDREGHPLKGVTVAKHLASLLEHSLAARPEPERLPAMFSFIAKHLVSMIPDRERPSYKSTVLKSAPKDVVFEQSLDDDSVGVAFTKSMFPSYYKVIFKMLNDTLVSKSMAYEGVPQLLEHWETAVHVFSSLALFIRVRSLRSTTMLTSALRDGCRFLTVLTQPSGTFLKLFERNDRLAQILDNVQVMLKEIQIGDRALQSIGVDAKEQQNITLLKLVPELRAQHEMFIRCMHSVFQGAGCGEAFSIGLLRSRNMDGDEIVDEGDPLDETPPVTEASGLEETMEVDFELDEE
uniref:Programmed cell death protein n=1 Tax=Steinernema glaseri TaxID=37863 RepID=A0A1I7YI62_9BILA